MSPPDEQYPHVVRDEQWDVSGSGRVVGGLGSSTLLGDLVTDQGARRLLLLTDEGVARAGIADRIASSLRGGGLAVSMHRDVPANPTLASLDAAALDARDGDVDCIVALGGGSVLDASKAVALLARTTRAAADLCTQPEPDAPVPPIVAVPTTAGTGAETNGFGVMENDEQRKVYLGSDRTVPSLVVLDAELTVGLPATVTAASGFDAVVHGAESLLSRGATTLSRAFATESLRLTCSALVRAVEDGADLEARSRMLTGAHLAGRALTLSGLGLVHGLGHALTATLGTPHGTALATVVGPALRVGIDACSERYRDLARALDLPTGPGCSDAAVQALVDLATRVGLPIRLADIGVPGDVVGLLADKALDDPVTRNSPRSPDRSELTEMLRASA